MKIGLRGVSILVASGDSGSNGNYALHLKLRCSR